MAYLYLAGTIIFTVYGQIMLKWRISKYGALPDGIWEKIFFLFKLLLDPLVLSGFMSAFIASLFWMMVMTKLDISVAYPFTSASFVLIFIISFLLFKEPISIYKVTGLCFIIIGIFISSKS